MLCCCIEIEIEKKEKITKKQEQVVEVELNVICVQFAHPVPLILMCVPPIEQFVHFPELTLQFLHPLLKSHFTHATPVGFDHSSVVHDLH